MFIDDEDVFLEECVAVLEASGAKHVEPANSVEAARELLARTEFDIVFLDLVLPDVSGEEFLLELDRLYRDLNVVVMTGKTGFDSDKLLRFRNVRACLRKPFGLDELHETLKAARLDRTVQKNT